MTVLEPGNWTVLLTDLLDETTGEVLDTATRMTVAGRIRKPKGNSLPCATNQSDPSVESGVRLLGGYGDPSAAPAVASVRARESVRQTRWELTVALDRATDRGGQADGGEIPLGCGTERVLPKSCIDALFQVRKIFHTSLFTLLYTHLFIHTSLSAPLSKPLAHLFFHTSLFTPFCSLLSIHTSLCTHLSTHTSRSQVVPRDAFTMKGNRPIAPFLEGTWADDSTFVMTT